MPKRLTDEDLKALHSWLEKQKINMQKMHREYADAVALAHLIKKFYPKLIDLHNYPPRNSFQLKLDNWETINQKVLVKLNIPQSKGTLEKLAKATPGALEILLHELMMLEEQSRLKDTTRAVQEQEQRWSENDDVVIINVNKKVGDAIVQVPQKMILFSIYEQALRESYSKDTYLTSAQQKIAHLENILKLKTERIDELCGQLAKLSVRTLLKQQNISETTICNNSLSRLQLHQDAVENNENCRRSIEN